MVIRLGVVHWVVCLGNNMVKPTIVLHSLSQELVNSNVIRWKEPKLVILPASDICLPLLHKIAIDPSLAIQEQSL